MKRNILKLIIVSVLMITAINMYNAVQYAGEVVSRETTLNTVNGDEVDYAINRSINNQRNSIVLDCIVLFTLVGIVYVAFKPAKK